MAPSSDDDPPDAAGAPRVDITGAAPEAPQPGRVSVTDLRDVGAPVDAERLRGLASAVLGALDVPGGMAVDVWCVDADEIAELNASHLDGDGPTDVLAFPLDAPGETPADVPEILGDVLLCPEVAAAQAREAGKVARDELEMLLVHGLLHLLGYDHQEPEERREMFAMTDRLLAAWREAAS